MSVLMVQQTLRFTPSAKPRVRKAVRLEPGPGGLRFTEISTANRRWDLFSMSAAAQMAVLFVLAWIPILYVQGPEPVRGRVEADGRTLEGLVMNQTAVDMHALVD